MRDDDTQHPGNDNEPISDTLQRPAQVGSIQSYPTGEDADLSTYDAVFRREADDADFSVVTDDDRDMPHVVPQGNPADFSAVQGDTFAHTRMKDTVQ